MYIYTIQGGYEDGVEMDQTYTFKSTEKLDDEQVMDILCNTHAELLSNYIKKGELDDDCFLEIECMHIDLIPWL